MSDGHNLVSVTLCAECEMRDISFGALVGAIEIYEEDEDLAREVVRCLAVMVSQLFGAEGAISYLRDMLESFGGYSFLLPEVPETADAAIVH